MTRPLRMIVLPLVLLVAAAAVGQEHPNLAPNPGFEVLDDTGWPEGWRKGLASYSLSRENPRSGDHCLKWANDDPSVYQMCSIPLTLEPGKRYEVRGWVRTEDLRGSGAGATFAIEWWRDNGEYIAGVYPGGCSGNTPDWTEVRGITARIPDDAGKINLLAYCRKGFVGTAWFDDLSVRVYEGPLVERMATSLYRGETTGGAVRAHVGLNLLDYDYAPGDIAAHLVILDGAGAAVHTIEPLEIAAESAVFAFDTTALALGDYTLRAVAQSRDGRLTGQAEERLHRVDAAVARKATIDEHQRLIVDGEPFFPLGTYWNTCAGDERSMTKEKLDIYAESDFNCLMPYDSPNVGIEQLDYAHDKGLKVIYSVKDFFVGKHGIKTVEGERETIARYVERYRDHPAIVAWYINDELPIEMYDNLRQHQVWMEELDPGRPTWVVLYQIAEVGKYLGTFDVIGTDPYPIPDSPPKRALDWTRRTVSGTLGLKPVWMVPQVFNWTAYRYRRDGETIVRGPTALEMRSMAWQCICGGANGLIFYSWMDLWRMEDLGLEKFEDRWPDVAAMAAEISRFIPVLLSTEEPLPLEGVEGSKDVAWRLYAREGSTYLVTVNSDGEPCEATFSFTEPVLRHETLLGADTVEHDGARLRVRFEGLEPKVIRLEP